MTDRPIIFSAPMVRALFDGRKTQTRRLASSPLAKCQPGDRLWVRESIALRDVERDGRAYPQPQFMADGSHVMDGTHRASNHSFLPRRSIPSIHMPRWASRLTLVVTNVRRQRLQEIDLADVLAEGAPTDPEYRDTTLDGSGPPMVKIGPGQWQTPRLWYHRLWDSLHGDGSWGANPEVVALTFVVHRCNIDRLGEEAA